MYVYVQVFALFLIMLSLFVAHFASPQAMSFAADMPSDRLVFSWYSIMMYLFSTDDCFTEEIYAASKQDRAESSINDEHVHPLSPANIVHRSLSAGSTFL